ncbi:MAG: hypothetical protein U0Q12_20975 [Vicinamibacterales bacterium]
MVLSKPELVSSLQNEVRILIHLAGKIDRSKLDYRPTPKQRSTIELLRYMCVMGPTLVQAAKNGAFDPAVWTANAKRVEELGLDEIVATLASHAEQYASLLADVSDADLRGSVDMFGTTSSRGSFLVNSVLCGCAAYRMQLFLYLKACGREELSTMNLWAGVDAPPPA